VRAREAWCAGEVVLGHTRLIEEVLGHEPSGGRRLAAEGEPQAPQRIEVLDVIAGLQPGRGVHDEDAVELGVDVALREDPRARCLQPGLHARQATEPDKIEVAGAEQADGGVVVGDRDVLHGHVEPLFEVAGHGPVEALQLLGVLIGDGADDERRGGGRGGATGGG
jgi:hypothetical protein